MTPRSTPAPPRKPETTDDPSIRPARSGLPPETQLLSGGGTRWLYISDVPFKDLGFPEDIPTKSIPATIHDYTKWKPGIFVGAAAVFGALGLYTKRRMKIENEQQQEGGKDNV